MALAEEVIQNHKGGNIDKHLKKIASENNMNAEEHQRLVEEYNVGAFLKKLADGSQHEEYDVASPVSVPSKSTNQSSGEIEKVASSGYGEVSYDMFNVSLDNDAVIETGDLSKVAHANVDDGLFSSEDKWSMADIEREKIANEMSLGLEKVAGEDALLEKVARLVKLSSDTEGQFKTAIATMAAAGMEDISIHMLENSKFSSFDIQDAKAEALKKEASDTIKEIVGMRA